MVKIRDFFRRLFRGKPRIIPPEVLEKFNRDFKEVYGVDMNEALDRSFWGEERKRLREALDKIDPLEVPVCGCDNSPTILELMDWAEKNIYPAERVCCRKMSKAFASFVDDLKESLILSRGLLRLRQASIDLLNGQECDCLDSPRFYQLLKSFVKDEPPPGCGCEKVQEAFEGLKDWDEETLSSALEDCERFKEELK